MPIGLVGRKCGMTRIFSAAGDVIPVTVIEALPNRVTMLKTPERDGYRAIQVTIGAKPAQRHTKAVAGHFAKNNVEPGEGLWEFRLTADEGKDLAAGAELKVDRFKVGELVDVSGTSKGKGYAGVMKRHYFGGQPASHGNSLSHSAPGAIGQRQTPGRVFPGKKMAGHLGNVRATVVSLEVVRIDADRTSTGCIRGHMPLSLMRTPARGNRSPPHKRP